MAILTSITIQHTIYILSLLRTRVPVLSIKVKIQHQLFQYYRKQDLPIKLRVCTGIQDQENN